MPNRLAAETSPYLQQHATNPVDWYPWGEEALTLARQLDKPILLSVGYSACHWCHVMAHESFEDPEVAAVMNELFVNIKVDREERPDLDQIYQTAHQMLNQRPGGWPLTMFLTPGQMPYYGGTYFPKTPGYQLPGIVPLLRWAADIYHTRKDDIAEQNASLLQALVDSVPQPPDTDHPGTDGTDADSPDSKRQESKSPAANGQDVDGVSTAPLHRAVEELRQGFDPAHGGFGAAPKFPRPTELFFLLRLRDGPADAPADGDDVGAADMALFTLRRMAEGGLFDQIGGGFYRYSVDDRWAIPHFEKMLYDNGPLLALYAEAHRLTGEPLFRRAAAATAAWCLREMQSPQGGYYSSLDADSEHEEGKFYVWTPTEVEKLLSPEEYALASRHFGLDRTANFEGRHWHLLVARPLPEVAAELGLAPERAQSLLGAAKAKLFLARKTRVRPGRDDKILSSWNALMIAGMSAAGRLLGEAAWVDSATRAVDFLRQTLWRDGRLLATYKDGRAHLNAYLDDYAFLLDALLELMQARFRPADLAWARQLADALLSHFEDTAHGGFYFTSHDHERLIHRPKPGFDNATPSGNGVAAYALQRLGHLLGEPRYLEAAARTLHLYYPVVTRHPSSFGTLLLTLQEALTPPEVVILRGPTKSLREWQAALAALPAAHRLTLALPNDLSDLPGALNKPAGPKVQAWVCRGTQCLPPEDSLDRLLAACNAPSLR